MNPTVLATVNQKGGVAKTTSCINIGAAMARKEKLKCAAGIITMEAYLDWLKNSK